MAQKPRISPSDLQLSCAQPHDLDTLVSIEEQSFPTPWSRTALKAYIGDRGFMVCGYQNQIAGYVLVGLQSPTLMGRLEQFTLGFLGQNSSYDMVGHVMNIAIHPEFRELGIGRHLLQTGLYYLRGLGATRVELEVRVNNDTALRLYESEGFEILKLLKGYYQNGDDAFLMSKTMIVL